MTGQVTSHDPYGGNLLLPDAPYISDRPPVFPEGPHGLQDTIRGLEGQVRSLWETVPEGLLRQKVCIEELGWENLQKNAILLELLRDMGVLRGEVGSMRQDLFQQKVCIEELKRENLLKNAILGELSRDIDSLRLMWTSQGSALVDQIKACMEKLEGSGKTTCIEELKRENLQKDQRIQKLEQEVGSLHSIGMSQMQIFLDQMGILSERIAYLESARKTDALRHNMMRAITAVPRGQTTGMPKDSTDPMLARLREFIGRLNGTESLGGDSARSSLGETTSQPSASTLQEEDRIQDTDRLFQGLDREYKTFCESIFLAQNPDIGVLREIAKNFRKGRSWSIEQRDQEGNPTGIASEEIRAQICSSHGDLGQLKKIAESLVSSGAHLHISHPSGRFIDMYAQMR